MLLSAFCPLEYSPSFLRVWCGGPGSTACVLDGRASSQEADVGLNARGRRQQSLCPQTAVFPSTLRFLKRKKQASRALLGVGMWKHPSLLRAQFLLQLQGVPCLRSALDLILFSLPPLPTCVSIMWVKCLCWPFMNREDHFCLQHDLLFFLGHACVSLLLLSSFSFLWIENL